MPHPASCLDPSCVPGSNASDPAAVLIATSNSAKFPSDASFRCPDSYVANSSLHVACEPANYTYLVPICLGPLVFASTSPFTQTNDTNTMVLQVNATSQTTELLRSVVITFGPNPNPTKYLCSNVAVQADNKSSAGALGIRTVTVTCTAPAGVGGNLSARLQFPFDVLTVPFAASYPAPIYLEGSLARATDASYANVSAPGPIEDGSKYSLSYLTFQAANLALILGEMRVTLVYIVEGVSTQVNDCYISSALGTTVRCSLPVGDGGPYNIQLEVAGQFARSQNDTYAYDPGPSITRVSGCERNVTGCGRFVCGVEGCPTDGSANITITGKLFEFKGGQPIVYSLSLVLSLTIQILILSHL